MLHVSRRCHQNWTKRPPVKGLATNHKEACFYKRLPGELPGHGEIHHTSTTAKLKIHHSSILEHSADITLSSPCPRCLCFYTLVERDPWFLTGFLLHADNLYTTST